MADLSKTTVNKLNVNTYYDAKGRTSFCWRYFGNLVVVDGIKKKVVNTDQVYCLACLNDVKKESNNVKFGSVKIKCYNRTVSTGNMTRHLRDDHKIVDTGVDDTAHTSVKDPAPSVPTPVAKRRKVSPSRSIAKGPYKTSKNKRLLARDIALWFCKSLLPLDSVCDDGMLHFFQKYNVIGTTDDLPTRAMVSGYGLTYIYESMLSKVKNKISVVAVSYGALTLDIWRDLYRGHNYVTSTLHYLTSDFVLETLTLSTNMLTAHKTEEEIRDVIEDVKNKFSLDDIKVIAVTSDERNVNRAVLQTNMTQHVCLGHGLHKLVTVDGIKSVPEIAALVQKCKNIIRGLRYHAEQLRQGDEKVKQLEFLVSLDTLAEAIESDEGNPIPQDELIKFEITNDFEYQISSSLSRPAGFPTAIPTRWHCVLEMLESVHTCNLDPINNMLGKIGQDDLKFTHRQWILLEDFMKFLKRFREVVEIISSQNTCTMNVALLFRSEIIDVLNTVQNDESVIITQLKGNMLANIDRRFPVTKETVAAALLDNRLMSLKAVDIYLENQNISRPTFLSTYIKEIIAVNDIPESNVTETSSNDNDTSLLHKLSKKHSINACQGVKVDPIEQECWHYFAVADPTEPKDEDLLSFWNSKKEAFPYLSALAKALLCVPATSTPSDRMFSAVGLTFTAKKCHITPAMMNKVIFIHDNYELNETDTKNEQ